MRRKTIGTTGWMVVALIVILGAVAPAPAASQDPETCNPCAYCPDEEEMVTIDSWGISTHNISAEPTTECKSWCNDFGETCDPEFAAIDTIIDAILNGEAPSITQFAAEERSQLRFIPHHNLVVALSACDDGWRMVFPVRDDEVTLARSTLEVLSSG